jgi:hypothetical protein
MKMTQIVIASLIAIVCLTSPVAAQPTTGTQCKGVYAFKTEDGTYTVGVTPENASEYIFLGGSDLQRFASQPFNAGVLTHSVTYRVQVGPDDTGCTFYFEAPRPTWPPRTAQENFQLALPFVSN